MNRTKSYFNADNSIRLWRTFLKQYYLIPETKSYELRNWAIILFLLPNVLRYLYLLSITDKNEFFLFGSVFYPFGIGGIIVYMAAAMVSLESLVCRTFLMSVGKKQHDKDKEFFFFTIPNGNDLHAVNREIFLTRTKLAYFMTKTALISTNYSSNMITLLSTIYCISQESLWHLKFLWLFWLACQAVVTYTATHIFIILGLWFIQQDYLNQQLKELVSSVNRPQRTHKGWKYITMEDINHNYTRILRSTSSFNQVSKVIIFFLTVCSTATNTSMLYGAMKTHQALFLFLSAILSITSLYPLWVATSLSLKARDLVKELNRKRSLVVQSTFDLIYARNIIKNCRDLSLRTLDGLLYEPSLFFEYVVSTVSLLLMLVEFVENNRY
jgi:hypothetical protein